MDKITKIIVVVVILAIAVAFGIQISLRGFERDKFVGTWKSENSSQFIFSSEGRVTYTFILNDTDSDLHGKYTIFEDDDSPLNQLWLMWDNADW